MTNKNLKLAAMSVALTACVAAQPMGLPMLWKAPTLSRITLPHRPSL